MKVFGLFLVLILWGQLASTQMLFDGETQIPAMSGWANAPKVINNPVKGGLNTSAKVMSWLKKNEANTWNGIVISTVGGFKVNAGAKFRMKIYSPIVTKVVMNFKGAVNTPMGERAVVAANSWLQLEWDIAAGVGKTYLGIEIFANPLFAADNQFYFDDFELVNCEIIVPPPPKFDVNFVMVDQFGYRPNDQKFAVIADPQVGFNSAESYTPGNIYQVRKVSDNQVVYEGSPVSWMNGEADAVSGDRGWWFDFTPVTEEGEFYVYDVEKDHKSHVFKIDPMVYKDVLKASIRMFYYQRTGIKHEAQFAGATWVDDAAYLQDSVAHFLDDPNNTSLYRDLRGGWMDAGDYNKYVTFVERPIHQLLFTYTENPELFTDDFNIPESGNGIPDILDEVKWELDWVTRMQDTTDGGVFIKMGNTDWNFNASANPPSADQRIRYYGPKCSSSSICAAGFFAHAALVYASYPQFSEWVDELKNRAVKAYNYYQSNPKSTNCDNQLIQAGDADADLVSQGRVEVEAAIYLYALTGESVYGNFVKTNYKRFSQMTGDWSGEIVNGEALLFYTTLPNADAIVKNDIIDKKIASGKTASVYFPQKHLYRANVINSYYWGGNSTRADAGNANMEYLTHKLDSTNHARYLNRALDILHYFNGINPFGMVYLTSMKDYGAESSATKIYHSWFNYGSKWESTPAPGYLPGGPNSTYTGADVPPKGQPLDKCYWDFNGGKNGPPSYEITEPMCSYQSTIVMLLSKFIGLSCDAGLLIDSVKVSDKAITLKQSSSYQLSATLIPYGVCNSNLQFISDNPDIATVDFSGKISALAPGEANIIAISIAEPLKRDTCVLTVIPCIRVPYSGSDILIPGTVEAENYDIGCGTEAYFDIDEGNLGNSYRTDNVDIEACSAGGYNVGWINTGEWLEYSVDVETAGDYDFIFYESANAKVGKIEITFSNGTKTTGSVDLPITKGWQNWQQVEKKKVGLDAGQQKMRINMVSDGFNFDKVIIQKTPPVNIDKVTSLNFTANVINRNLEIKFPVNNYSGFSIQLIDISGKIVFTNSIKDSNSTIISMEKFSKGAYIVKVISGNYVGTKKIVVVQ